MLQQRLASTWSRDIDFLDFGIVVATGSGARRSAVVDPRGGADKEFPVGFGGPVRNHRDRLAEKALERSPAILYLGTQCINLKKYLKKVRITLK